MKALIGMHGDEGAVDHPHCMQSKIPASFIVAGAGVSRFRRTSVNKIDYINLPMHWY